MSALRVVLATANPDKAAEIARIADGRLELLPRPPEVPEVEEAGETLLDNACLKARAVCRATGLPALADDTGLEVDALGGAPGVRSSRYAGPGASYEDNVARLLAELAGVPEGPARAARFRTVAVLAFCDGREIVGEGVVQGRITTAPRGTGGFGYDPVFVPDEDPAGRTFAEMTPEEKNAISHRARAVAAVLEALGV